MTKPRKILRSIANALFPFYPFKTANKRRELRYRITSAFILWFCLFLLIKKLIGFGEILDLLKFLFE